MRMPHIFGCQLIWIIVLSRLRLPPTQEARALESKQRQLQAALDRAQREGRALNGQQERVAALGVQLAEAQVRRAANYVVQRLCIVC